MTPDERIMELEIKVAFQDKLLADLDEVVRIFFETVRHVNGRDYNPQQIEAWAPMNPDFPRWSKRMTDNVSFVARMDQEAVGFAALRADGYLDVLYVDWKHQGEGIATLLLARCEEEARKLGLKRLFTDASITARPSLCRGSCQCCRP